MNLTSQQTDFINTVLAGQDNTTLQARAGTGKTSTILATVAALHAANPRQSVVICAYSKDIEIEITGKLQKIGYDWKFVVAKTIHALGFGLVRQAFGGVQLS